MGTGSIARLRVWPVVLAVCGLFSLQACSSQSASDAQSKEPAALVKTAPAIVGPVETRLRLYGAADGGTAANRSLAPLVEAILVRIEAPVGTRVPRNGIVARLQPSPASALDVARARADAAAAVSQFARMRRLRSDGLASDADVESARLAAQSSQALTSSLALRQSSLVLRAPFAAIVNAVNASPGDTIAPGATIATLVPASATRAKFGIDPEEARLVRAGEPFSILDASGTVKFSVPIQSVDPGVDPVTRLAAVYVMLPSNAAIGSGEPLIGEVAIQTSNSLPTIPYGAILSDAGQPYVFVVRNGTARRVNIVIGAASKTTAAVMSGIKAGDVVVTDGGTALDDGMKVRLK